MRWLGLAGLALALACSEAPRQEVSPGGLEPEDTALAPVGASEAPLGDVLEVGRSRTPLQPWATGKASVATDGEGFLTVWRDQRSGGIFGARVKKDGKVLDPTGLILNPGNRLPFSRGGPVAVAFDGTDYLVVWRGDPDVIGVRVRRDGTVVDLEGFRILHVDSGDEPAVACDDGGRCLVVVLDIGGDDANVVRGVRVTREPGVPPVAVPIARGEVSSPRVAWTGSRFLVVWDEERSEGLDILGARVELDGTLLDATPFVISGASGDQRTPDVARAGDLMWVVWEDSRRGERDIFGARVREATVLDGEGLALSTAAGAQSAPRVEDAGDLRSFVLWTDARDEKHVRVRGARVADDGTLVNRLGFPVSSEDFPAEEAVDLACRRDMCLATYQAPLTLPPYYEPQGYSVLATRLTLPRGALDSPALELSRSAPAQLFPAMAWGEDSYLVVWQEADDEDGPTLRATRVRRDGGVVDREGVRLPSAPGASHPAVAFDGREFLVVWQEPHPAGEDIRGARVSASGRLLDRASLAISRAPVRQLSPSVAGGAGGFLVVWEDSRDGALFDLRYTPFAARVSREGRVLDPEGLRLAPPARYGTEPDVVSMGRDFLVAWSGIGIEGTRVSPEGVVLDPAGLALSPPTFFFEHAPALAFDGTTALVVWVRSGDVLGTRVAPDGAVVGPPGFTVSSAPEDQWMVNVTFDGARHRVVWLETRPPANPLNPLSVREARVTPDGQVLDGGPAPALPDVTTDFPFASPPALAGDGAGGALLLHTRFLTDPKSHSLRLVGRRLLD
ncbi:hypothetical protein P2318_29570 [Myxococcaceae bacterium GXIMD 01537]